MRRRVAVCAAGCAAENQLLHRGTLIVSCDLPGTFTWVDHASTADLAFIVEEARAQIDALPGPEVL